MCSVPVLFSKEYNKLENKTSIEYIPWTWTRQLSNFSKNFNKKLKDTE